MNKINYQFSCRVFAGKVISVDCAGFPSELFAAKIIDGRIRLHNIAREQCCEYILNFNKSRCESASSQEDGAEQHIPLANSTPARIQRLLKENRAPERRFSTPDIVRRVVTHQRSSPISFPSAQQRLKIVPLHRTPTANTPMNLARISPSTSPKGIVRKSVTQVQILRNISNLSNFETPLSPHTLSPKSCYNASINSSVHPIPAAPQTEPTNIAFGSQNLTEVIGSTLATPNNFQTLPCPQRINNTITFRSPNRTIITKLIGSPLAAPCKWRKCLTPQRTYTRKNVALNSQNLSNNATSKPVNLGEKSTVKPSYLINQTKCPVGEVKVIFQRRKLIVDKKLMISPKTFKKQLQYTKDLECDDVHLPKTRKQFIYSHQLAFDLLTNSSYYPRCANVHNLRFRRGCLNKKSETISKYQQLINSIPDLED